MRRLRRQPIQVPRKVCFFDFSVLVNNMLDSERASRKGAKTQRVKLGSWGFVRYLAFPQCCWPVQEIAKSVSLLEGKVFLFMCVIRDSEMWVMNLC